MQFRERRRVIQVIRTVYDPGLKRGRSEVVGTLDKAAPAVTEALRAACTAEELEEVGAYLRARLNTQRGAAVRAGAETLPEQMRKAAEYFRTHQDEEALAFAAEIRAAWEPLKEAMRDAGFSKSKVKQGKPKGKKAAEAPATPPPGAASGTAGLVYKPDAVTTEAAPRKAVKGLKLAKAAKNPSAVS
ncbi:MAG TPA: hypothetical protein VD995_05335 [Azospirillum sp.]|nr:hypothetical protein [Azospirillum sp.]